MRDEFYADGKDVWKWACTLDAAEGKTHILHVAMYRPDKRRSYGKTFCNLEKNGKRVVSFFDEERQLLRQKDLLRRVERLDSRIEVLSKPYSREVRVRYFEEVVNKLKRRTAGSYVVLLDPDTGIEPTKSSDNHVCCDDIRSIWRGMNPGDILLVVQFCRFEHQAESCQQKLRSVLDGEVRALLHPATRNVRILRADK